MIAIAIKDKTGNKYGRLHVERFLERKNRRTYFEAICECGNVIRVRGDKLTSGHTKSCGCLNNEKRKFIHLSRSSENHGMSKTRFYSIWTAMKVRCNRKNSTDYHLYGKRGIKVCSRWEDFINFKEDMYDKYQNHLEFHGEKNTTLDRIDPNGNYEYNNCRWATWEIQNNNKRKKQT